MSPDVKERIEKRRKELYLAVKFARPELYEAAVRVGHLAMMEFHPAGTDEVARAAEVECAAMDLVARAAGIHV